MKSEALTIVEPREASNVVTPMALLQVAMDKGADLDKLERLMEMQIKWEEKEAKQAYHKAVSAFKNEAITILKDKRVSFSTSKGKTEYDHATLGKIIKTVVPVLSNHGLSHRWDFAQPDNKVQVTCILSHELGHSQTATLIAARDESGGKNGIQAISSAVSYLERYTFLGITGLAAEDQDDDAQTAVAKQIETISGDQFETIDTLVAVTGTDEAAFCTYYKCDKVENLPASKFEHARKSLEAKVKS